MLFPVATSELGSSLAAPCVFVGAPCDPPLLQADWRLGITVKSSGSDVVEVPFVTMILRTSDADGRVSGHPLQMSLAEFRVRLFTVGGAVPSATVPVCRDSWGGLSRCFDVALWVLQTFADSLREAAACMDKM